MSKSDQVFSGVAANVAPTALPLPRLELSWSRCTNKRWLKDGWNWICTYELLLPLQPGDRRRKAGRDHMRVRIGKTKRGNPDNLPCTARWAPDGYADAPFRDGAHAMWDSEALGNLPIFVRDLDGKTFPFEQKKSS